MRVGLIDVDSKIGNLALMKISAYHKKRGDSVEWAFLLDKKKYDKIYASSLFDFTFAWVASLAFILKRVKYGI